MDLILAILVFGLLIFVHELGHFVAAKLVGAKVTRFQIGFGPNIGFSLWGTKFSIGILPFGGFIAMPAEYKSRVFEWIDNYMASRKKASDKVDDSKSEIQVEEEDDFEASGTLISDLAIWKQNFVSFAGPFANFLAAALALMAIMMFSGVNVVSDHPVVAAVVEDSVAERAGVINGDKILTVNGVEIGSRSKFVELLADDSTKNFNFVFKRNETELTFASSDVELSANAEGRRLLGVHISDYELEQKELTFFEALAATWDGAVQFVTALPGLFSSLGQAIDGADWSAEDKPLGGPVQIVQVLAGSTTLVSLTWMFIILNLNLGIINLIPLPILDGGAIVFGWFKKGVESFGVEWLSWVYEIIYTLAAVLTGVLIIAFMIFITYHDIF